MGLSTGLTTTIIIDLRNIFCIYIEDFYTVHIHTQRNNGVHFPSVGSLLLREWLANEPQTPFTNTTTLVTATVCLHITTHKHMITTWVTCLCSHHSRVTRDFILISVITIILNKIMLSSLLLSLYYQYYWYYYHHTLYLLLKCYQSLVMVVVNIKTQVSNPVLTPSFHCILHPYYYHDTRNLLRCSPMRINTTIRLLTFIFRLCPVHLLFSSPACHRLALNII